MSGQVKAIVMRACVAAGVIVLAGCSNLSQGHPTASTAVPGSSSTVSPPDTKVTTVHKDILVQSIMSQLSRSGVTPQSVVCQQDLVGQVGQTVRCEVTITPLNSFEPVVAVTVIEGEKVSYTITPSVNKSQLEIAVKDMVNRSTHTDPDAVVCESGLDGKVGAVAFCNVTVGGVTNRQAVAVTQVQGLAMAYGLAQVNGNAPAPNPGLGPTLAKNIAEGALLAQLKRTGQNPDSVTCAGDMPAAVGATQTCTAVTAGQNQNYLLILTAVANGSYTFKYQLVQ